MRKMRCTVTPAIALLLLFIIGCGDSPELRMQQAQIAMANGKPDQALDIVSSVLDEKPDDLAALQLKARAHMLLAQLGASKKTLDKLIEDHPDNAEIRRHLIDWTWFEIRNVLTQSDFATNEKLQNKFSVAMSTGQAQAEWLATHENAKAESKYSLARYAHFDAQRLRIMLKVHKKSLSSVSLNNEDRGSDDTIATQMEGQIEDRLDEATDYLSEAIAADPKHFAAGEMYAGFLVQRKRWPDLWAFAVRLGEIEGLPASTAQRLVSTLLAMPNSEQPKDRRVELCWKMQSGVKETDQASPNWQITSARLHLVASEWTQAKPILEMALKTQPQHIEAQYLLSQCLYGLEQFNEARAILEKLSVKSPRSAQIQTLYGLVLMQTDEKVLAKEALRRATDLNPDDPVAREAFLSLMAREGHFDQAQGDIDEYLKRHPADPRAIRYKLQFEQAQGKLKAVEKLLQGVETLSPC